MSIRAQVRWFSAIIVGLSLFAIGSRPKDSQQAPGQRDDSQCADCGGRRAFTCYLPGSLVPFQRYALTGTKWPQPGGTGSPVLVTYSYSNLLDGAISGVTQEQLIAAAEECLSLWASIAPINFVEVPDSGPLPDSQFDVSYDGQAAAHIRFGCHQIDGRGNVAAHAYYPAATIIGLAGDVHFDFAERWGRNSGGLFLEACLHELGHALGLAHETSVNAIMNPVLKLRFNGLGSGYLLPDDIAGIQAAYGVGVGSVTPLESAPPQPEPVLSPDPVYPTGEIAETSPTFEWNAVSGAAAYYVQVEDLATGALVVDTGPVQATTFTPSTPLTAGRDYDWHVRAEDDIGTSSDWSEVIAFSIAEPPAPDPIPIYPIGKIADLAATLEWVPAIDAESYHLQLKNFTTGETEFIVNNVIGTTFTPSAPFTEGSVYGWKVRARYADGTYGPWIGWVYFNCVANPAGPPQAPLDPEPTYPIGPIAELTPTFEWVPAADAVSHHLQIKSFNSGAIEVNVNYLPGNTFLPEIAYDESAIYSWKVRAMYPDGSYGPWTGWNYFSFAEPSNEQPQAPVDPEPTYPIGPVAELTPTFEWVAAADAVSHHLQVRNFTSGATEVDVRFLPGNTYLSEIAYDQSALYSWKVRAMYVDGSYGPWSDWTYFSVGEPPDEQPQAPLDPEPTYPIGPIAELTPTFEWIPAADAISYHLQLMNFTTWTAEVNVKFLAGNTFTSETPCNQGSVYGWKVRAMYADGTYGPWIGWVYFSCIEIPNEQAPADPIPIYPAGPIAELTPTYEWVPAADAVAYELQMQNRITSQTEINVKYLFGNMFNPGFTLVDGGVYRWKVRALYSDGTRGNWSPWTDFTTGGP